MPSEFHHLLANNGTHQICDIMIHTLTKKHLGALLEEAEIELKLDEEGDYIATMDADDEFPYDVHFWFLLDESGETLTTAARCVDLEFDNVLAMANELNDCNAPMKAIADEEDNTIGFNASYSVEGLSDEYVSTTCLFNFAALVWKTYTELYQSMEEE